MRKYIKFILNKDEVITIIALLAELRDNVNRIKDPKIKDEILGYMYENFDADDVALFNDIDKKYKKFQFALLIVCFPHLTKRYIHISSCRK